MSFCAIESITFFCHPLYRRVVRNNSFYSAAFAIHQTPSTSQATLRGGWNGIAWAVSQSLDILEILSHANRPNIVACGDDRTAVEIVSFTLPLLLLLLIQFCTTPPTTVIRNILEIYHRNPSLLEFNSISIEFTPSRL